MYTNAFTASALPYYFTVSSSVGTLGKETDFNAALGREGLFYNSNNDSLGFYFAISDINADGKQVAFTEIEDAAVIQTSNDLNKYLVTVPFTVNDNSVLTYSLQTGLKMSDIPFLVSEYEINLRVELLDDATNEVLDVFNSLKFNGLNQPAYETNSFSINTSGIGDRTVKLRFISETNVDAPCALASIYSEDQVVAKTTFGQIDYKGVKVITEYMLEQNYPNPFNPNTTITYQLPKDGYVTLKIFDALGNEVSTIVNEVKTTGRYSVNFDASNLASGAYFYQIKVNDFSSTKKLILMK